MSKTITSLTLVLSLVLAGCQFGKPTAYTAGAGGMDMFGPVKMRVHPLSRVIPADKVGDAGIIEAHLEFTDQFGDVTKSPGTLYFELFSYESLIPNHRGDRIHLWNFDLGTPQLNKDHWDPITRTYVFKLPLPPEALKDAKRIILSCTLAIAHDGETNRLQDDQMLTVK